MKVKGKELVAKTRKRSMVDEGSSMEIQGTKNDDNWMDPRRWFIKKH